MTTRFQHEASSAAPSCLVDLVDQSAAAHADRTAVIDEQGHLSYRVLADSAGRLAGALADAGVQRGDRVGLWLPNSAFWLQAHLALSRIGAIAVGINARYPAYETADVLRAASVNTLVIDPAGKGLADSQSLAELLAAPGVKLARVVCRTGTLPVPQGVVCLDGARLLEWSGDIPSSTSADSPSTVFTSSGSTGTPKLILHSQAGIATHSRAVAIDHAYTAEGSTVLGQLPLCGVWGFNTAYAALAGGATLVLMERFEAAAAVDLIRRHGVTYANGPDLFVRQLFTAVDGAKHRLASMRAIGFSTFSNDSRELVDLGDALGITLFQVYGSSEQQALMVRRPAGGSPEERADAGGRPSTPGTCMRIRHADTGELVQDGEPGLLETTGPNVMLGYLAEDGIDTSAFTDDGWLRTGDVAQLTDAGMRYLSRAKDVLRLSGFLVDPQEIELRLEELTDVLEAKVVAVSTPQGSRCVAFVRVADPDRFSENVVLETCRRSLASFKVPSRVFPVDDFPRIDGANGPRIQRLALRDMAVERLSA